MATSNGRPGVTDDYAALVRPAKAPEGTPDPAVDPAHRALTTPYTLDRWRADLRQMAAGIPTGFDALEEVGLHWHPGRVYGVIARPGDGKTAFLLEAVLRFLEAHPEETALFLSWEEPVSDVVSRLVLREDSLHARNRRGDGFGEAVLFRSTVRHYARGDDVGDYWRGRLERAEETLAPKLARLRLVDGDELGRGIGLVLRSVAQLTREAQRFGLVAVDYFQKLRAGDLYHSRQVELQAVSDMVRRFAKGADLASGDTGAADRIDPAFAVPVLMAAQVTRGGGPHPDGESIREADDLLNDVSAILALSRETVPTGDDQDESRHLRLSVPKNRGGRARDDVARYRWHPARDWFALGAERTEDRIRWEMPPKPEAPGRRNGDTPRRAVIDRAGAGGAIG